MGRRPTGCCVQRQRGVQEKEKVGNMPCPNFINVNATIAGHVVTVHTQAWHTDEMETHACPPLSFRSK